MLEFFSFLSPILPFVEPVAYVISAATAVTAITPSKSDDKILDVILGVLNFLAGNFLKNKNKDA